MSGTLTRTSELDFDLDRWVGLEQMGGTLIRTSGRGFDLDK